MNLRMLDSDQTVDEVCKDPSFFYTCTGQRGRKIKYDRAELRKTVRKLPYKQRRTYKDLAAATGVPKTVLHAMTKSEGVFRRHTSSLKPVLTEENKVSRFEYCIEEIYGEPDRHGDYHYKDLYDRIDVDEKWFYMTKDQEKYIVVDSDFSSSTETEEEEVETDVPTRRTRHKNYIGKVMFLSAQARPRWDAHRNAWWDGKIGMWPIGDYKPAQRAKGRPIRSCLYPLILTYHPSRSL